MEVCLNSDTEVDSSFKTFFQSLGGICDQPILKRSSLSLELEAGAEAQGYLPPGEAFILHNLAPAPPTRVLLCAKFVPCMLLKKMVRGVHGKMGGGCLLMVPCGGSVHGSNGMETEGDFEVRFTWA